jgi:HSP20 family protein
MTRSLIPWGTRFPWALGELQRGMDSLMQEFFGPENGTEMVAGFTPRVNVAETENEYDITVDLPGMKSEELDVELKHGELWITGERKQADEEKGETYHRVERRYGRFQRVIPLAAPTDESAITASYKDGVLHVNVPKTEEARPKRIQITT